MAEPPPFWSPTDIASNPRARKNQGFMRLLELAGPPLPTCPEDAWITFLTTGSLNYLPPNEPYLRTDTLDLYHLDPDRFNRLEVQVPRCTFMLSQSQICTNRRSILLGEHLPSEDPLRRRCMDFLQRDGGLAPIVMGSQPRPLLPSLPSLNLPAPYLPYRPPAFNTWTRLQPAMPQLHQVCLHV